ncbi:helix-turn-helix transcriptional regulator [Streptomyces katsurahamanus]|uniref:helix-turn-helix transcriptional regulator n=1 Tax=Streptomyces katsurahamanus TaxID=2577098 RepID=UPI002B1FD6F5|nr:helix-turn-helix transcriptional regulator [Streptomyces katsurahamanus]
MSTRETDTEAFARRVHAIREESGRSFGALARRVGVSASTLHRYCSGRTVPMEFAPVERLARVCGCQGEELVALHRLWVLADAERRRRQEAASGAGGGGGLVPSGSGSGVPETGSAPAVRATGGPGSDPGSGADPDAGQGPGPDPVPGGAEVPGEGPGVPGAPGRLGRLGGAAVRDRRPRRRTAYAAAVVLTTVIALMVLVAFDRIALTGSGRDGTEARLTRGGGPGPAARSPSASVSAPTAPPSGSSGSSEASGSSAEPSKRAGGTAGASRPGARGPSAKASAAAEPPAPVKRPGGGTPFTVTADQHRWQHSCQHTYLVDRPPGDVPPPPAEADARPWAGALRAVHGGDTVVGLTVQGRDERAVVLQALRVRVVAKRAPLQRNAYRMSLGCGGAITPRVFDADLDRPRPTVRSVAGSDAGVELPAVALPYRVSVRDPEVLLVTGRTTECDCDWYLELDWSSGDRSGTVRIDDGGRPFRTSGVRDRPAYEYDTIAGRWIPAG